MRISAEAKAAIEAYCRAEGISMSAWFEAIGRRVTELRSEAAADTSLKRSAADTARIARAIDVERRARGPRKDP